MIKGKDPEESSEVVICSNVVKYKNTKKPNKIVIEGVK